MNSFKQASEQDIIYCRCTACLVLVMISSSLTLMHVTPAADRAAMEIRERHVFVWQTDGSDEGGSLHTPPILLLQFDQNWKSRHSVTEDTKNSVTEKTVNKDKWQTWRLRCPMKQPHPAASVCVCMWKCVHAGEAQGHSCSLTHSCAHRLGPEVSFWMGTGGPVVYVSHWYVCVCVFSEDYRCHVVLD